MLRHVCRKGGIASIQRVNKVNIQLHPYLSQIANIHNDAKKTVKNKEQVKKERKDKVVSLESQSSTRLSGFRSFSVAPSYDVDEIKSYTEETVILEKLKISQDMNESDIVEQNIVMNDFVGSNNQNEIDPLLHSKIYNFGDEESSDAEATEEVSSLQDEISEIKGRQTIDDQEQNQVQRPHHLERKLSIAISRRNLDAAMHPFWILTRRNDISVRIGHFVNLLDLACKQNDIFASYKILQKIDIQQRREALENFEHNATHPVPISTYIDMCRSIRNSEETPQKKKFINSIISFLFFHLQGLDHSTYQQEIFPEFFFSVLSRPDFNLLHSGDIWAHMEYKKISCPNHILEKVLKYSFLRTSERGYRDSKKREIPFDQILEQLIDEGVRPESKNVIQTLLYEYPFSDVEKTTKVLQCVKKLYETKEGNEKSHDYRVSAGTLDCIAASASREGHTDLLLLVWDLVDLMGYKPSEYMFENAIHCFMIAYKQDHHAFAVLAEMEAYGYTPSRSLTQRISKSLSYSAGRVDNAYYILTNGTQGTAISTSSLNCILAACARLGHVDNAFSTYDLFEKKGLKPNSDTFSYLLETLAKDLKNAYFSNRQGNDQENKTTEHEYHTIQQSEPQLEAAYAVISMMNDFNVQQTQYSIHFFSRILTYSSKLDEAKALFHDAIESKIRIRVKTFRLLLVHYIKSGDVSSAYEVCDMMRNVAEENGYDAKNRQDIVPHNLLEDLNKLARQAKTTSEVLDKLDESSDKE